MRQRILIDEEIALIETVLSNVENASDQELVEYFMKELALSEEMAREWVAKRDQYLNLIVPKGENS